MTTPVTVVRLSSWNLLGSVTKHQTSSWNVGQPVQQSMAQLPALPWISTYPS